MEPPIQYATTEDGFNIAYWAMGESSSPLIAMPSMPWSHLQLEWTIPEVRRWYEQLGKSRMLVRYDGRGFGLSTRDVDSVSLDTEMRDLEAVIDRIGLERVDLFAGLHSGPPAIAYTAAHPDRVEHLVLFCSYADGEEFGDNPLTQATRPIINQAWGFYTEMVARLLLGWTENEAAMRFARLVKECTTPEMAHRALMATREYDVTDLLEAVQTPTLVMQRGKVPFSQMELARALAAGIPGAQMSVLEGSSVAPYLEDSMAVAREIDAFLGGDGAFLATEGVGSLRTILFTDIEGSTTLTERLGDEPARALMRRHDAIVREELARHDGTEIKATGDGFMASFGSAMGAVECAIGLQRRFAVETVGGDDPIRVRVGMTAGEPIAEDGDLYGSAVNAAARIGAEAEGGEILVSDVVRQLVAGKGFQFGDLGSVELRGFDEAQRLYRVEWASPG